MDHRAKAFRMQIPLDISVNVSCSLTVGEFIVLKGRGRDLGLACLFISPQHIPFFFLQRVVSYSSSCTTFRPEIGTIFLALVVIFGFSCQIVA